jgi:hypothetical protein
VRVPKIAETDPEIQVGRRQRWQPHVCPEPNLSPVDAGSWDMYRWLLCCLLGTGCQSSLNSDQNQIIVLGHNR